MQTDVGSSNSSERSEVIDGVVAALIRISRMLHFYTEHFPPLRTNATDASRAQPTPRRKCSICTS